VTRLQDLVEQIDGGGVMKNQRPRIQKKTRPQQQVTREERVSKREADQSKGMGTVKAPNDREGSKSKEEGYKQGEIVNRIY